jgi:putative peptidoglycan lipid II flippase
MLGESLEDGFMIRPVRLPTFRKLIAPGLLGAGILATFGREMVFAKAYGTNHELEIFRLAFGPANMMAQTLAPVFVGVLLPILAQAAAASPSAERQLRRRILRLNVWGVLALGALGALLAAPMARWLAPGYQADQLAKITEQLRILWIYFTVFGMTFGLRVFLNYRESFWPGAAASLAVSSTFVVVGLFIANDALPATAGVLSWTAIAGGVVVLLCHLCARPIRHGDLKPSSETSSFQSGSLLIPLCGAAFYQISAGVPRFLDRGFSSSLPQGSVAALEYSYNVLTAPGILLGTSFVMMAYPAFVRNVAAGRARHAAIQAARPLVAVLGIALLVSLAVYFFATPLVDLIYQRGEFSHQDVASTSSVLAAQSLGLMPMVAGMVLVQALLGLRCIRLLVVVSVIRIALRWLALDLLVPRFGLTGVGIAYSITEVVILLVWITLFLVKLPPDKDPAIDL